MKTHSMNLQPAPFTKIKSGKKSIELRLYDEKRRQIQAGDEILFTQTESGEMLRAKVIALYPFASFRELYSALPLEKCGYAAGERALPEDMRAYYSAEDELKWGVVGIEIQI